MKRIKITFLMFSLICFFALTTVGCVQTGSGNMGGESMDSMHEGEMDSSMESMSEDKMDKNMDAMEEENMDRSMNKDMQYNMK
jgi:hypothetical protein